MQRIAIIDIEATGPHFEQGDRMIQLAAVMIEKGVIVARHSMLLNPQQNIPATITQLTGIEQADVDGAPTFESVASLWQHRLSECVIVAHNLSFDLSYLEKSFAACGLEWQAKATIDTLNLAKILVPTAKGFTVSDLAQHFHIAFTNAHDALADALATTYILDRLSRTLQQLPVDTQHLLCAISDQLQGQEQRFFQIPQQFQLVGEDWKREDRVSEREGECDCNQKALAKWVQMEWDLKKTSLPTLVSSFQAPIAYELLPTIALQSEQPCVLMTSYEWQEASLPADWALFYRKREFLTTAGLEWLQKHYPELALNQTELIILMAITMWQSQTQTGLYSELNSETQPQNLFDKYLAPTLVKKDRPYYQQYIKRLKCAKVLIVPLEKLGAFQYFVQLHEAHFSRYHLLVDDSEHLVLKLQQLQKQTFELSQTFTAVQSYVDYLSYTVESLDCPNHLLQQLRALLSSLNMLIEYASVLLRAQVKQEIKQQIEVQRMLTAEQWQVCRAALEKAQSTLREVSRVMKGATLKINVTTLQDILRKLLKMDGVEGAYTVSAMYFNDHLFQLKVHYAPLQVHESQVAWLDSFSQVLIVERGTYALIDQAYLPIDVMALPLPDLYQPMTTVKVPLGYAVEQEIAPMMEVVAKASASASCALVKAI